MRYKRYLKIIKTHLNMHLRSPLILLDLSRNSDTYRRVMRYISSHRLDFEVDIYTNEFDGCEIPSISLVPTDPDYYGPW